MQFALFGLLTMCLASFTWAMRNFFVRPAGMTSGMKVVNVCGIICALLHFAAILLTPDVPLWRGVTGAVLYLNSLALFWWTIRTNAVSPLSAIFSPDSPVHLMDQGPYSWVRHPFYCSYLLMWIAGCFATARLWLLPTLAGMLVLYLAAARAEERKFLTSALAPAYERYRARTGQLFPNPLKLRHRRSI